MLVTPLHLYINNNRAHFNENIIYMDGGSDIVEIVVAIIATVAIIIIYMIESVFRISVPYSGGKNTPHRTQKERDVNRYSLFNDNEYQKLFKSYIKKSDLSPIVTFSDIKERLKYRSHNIIFRPTYHIGQRKLFNNELQFLTEHLAAKDDPALVVYAGSSPSNHIWYLHTLFPNVKFLLVDPSETIIYTKEYHPHYKFPMEEIIYLHSGEYNLDSDVYYLQNGESKFIKKSLGASNAPSESEAVEYYINDNTHRIYIYEDFFTVPLANLIREKAANAGTKLYFWSDIRTNSGNEEPHDIDIMWNMAQQYNWVVALAPEKYMLKFRMPFHDTSAEIMAEKMRQEPYKGDFEICQVDFISSYNTKKLEYLSGTIYLQSYAGQTSTESRLVGDGKNISLTVYDMLDYDDAFFYYNNLERTFVLHKNIYADKDIGYDHCGDCSLEAHIWDQYRQKMAPEFDVPAAVRHMITITRRDLFKHGHGHLFEKFSAEKYAELAQKYLT
jgi:hypothetical protein